MADDIAQWLEGLGLGQYATAIADNGVDFDILPRLSDDELKELGFGLGDRHRLKAAIEALDGDSSIENRDRGVAHGLPRACDRHPSAAYPRPTRDAAGSVRGGRAARKRGRVRRGRATLCSWK